MHAFVDTHIHFWEIGRFPYPWMDHPICEPFRNDFTPVEWREEADALPVLATVHVQAEIDHDLDPVKETEWLAGLSSASAGAAPAICIGYADLRAPNLADILDRHAAYPLFRGIRQETWCDPQSDRADILRINLLDDPEWRSGLDLLAARGLSFDLLTFPYQLDQACDIFRGLPDLKLVIEHLGVPAPADEDAMAAWRAGLARFANEVPNAALKISAMGFIKPDWSVEDVAPFVDEAIALFGPSRCMFGSNYPVERPALTYAELWRRYDALTADLSQADRQAVFVDTAKRIYRI